MSHNSMPVADVNAASHSNGVAPPSTEELSPEAKAALVARARDIIAGRVRPPALTMPPEYEKAWQWELANCTHPPSQEYVRLMTDRFHLEARYKGELVAVVTTVDGYAAVLAGGLSEIRALLEGLSPEEEAKVLVTDTMPF